MWLNTSFYVIFYYEYRYSPHKLAFQNMRVGDQKLMIDLEWPNSLYLHTMLGCAHEQIRACLCGSDRRGQLRIIILCPRMLDNLTSEETSDLDRMPSSAWASAMAPPHF